MSVVVFVGLCAIFISILYYFFFGKDAPKQSQTNEEQAVDEPQVVNRNQNNRVANRIRNRRGGAQNGSGDEEEVDEIEEG